MGLTLICDGQIHTLQYLHNNGVFPKSIVLEHTKLRELVPYLTDEDELLILVNGLTDFTMSSLYSFIQTAEELRDKLKGITILSNIPLGVVDFDYYLYSGDLFYGTVKKVIDNKVYDLDENGNLLENRRGKLKVREIDEGKNPISFRFKKFNDNTVKLMVYGKTTFTPFIGDELEYESEVISIDLYE